MKSHEYPREPSLIPYLAVATAIVGVVFSVLITRVERAAVPLEAHVARSIGIEPVSETALARNEADARPHGEPFRPRT